MITLETCRALKWEWETEKHYCVLRANPTVWILKKRGWVIDTDFDYYPSPSLEELLTRMPEHINISTNHKKEYLVEYFGKDHLRRAEHTDPAEAVALLWIKLRNEGLV